MKNYGDNPRLKEDLRQEYRSVKVSPFLLSRVVANIESENRARLPWRRFAATVLPLAAIIFVVFIVNRQENVEMPVTASLTHIAPELPGMDATASKINNSIIPGLASLMPMPGLNRVTTPSSSSYNPGDICIYNPKGEIPC